MQFYLDLQLHAYPRISTHLSMYVAIVIIICMYVGISLQNKMRLTFINMTTLWQCFCCCWWWKIIHFCTHENDKRRGNKTNDNWTTATNTNDRRRESEMPAVAAWRRWREHKTMQFSKYAAPPPQREIKTGWRNRIIKRKRVRLVVYKRDMLS